MKNGRLAIYLDAVAACAIFDNDLRLAVGTFSCAEAYGFWMIELPHRL
jgi:hypothetical protein